MKKVILLIITIIMAIAGVSIYSGQAEQNNDYNYNNYDTADYYGCPNSKRIKKLNLKKSDK